ncbi:MAG: 3-deoxy-manno-octulosonate cytidylyltransferase [Muribaculaceae bacterium]|nr:3-deoxy-manno-octulosonate cytidylyltransferase [Muribaculaceae bacterium]
MTKFIGIIPARYASGRLPGKPLLDIGGKPMIQRVFEQASKALGADKVWVATDDQRIFDAVTAFGGQAVMTSENHRSGTDRIAEAASKIGADTDVVINIQGDEPFIDPEQIKLLANSFDSPETDIATLIRPVDPTEGFNHLEDPNKVKVVKAEDDSALYFSRSVIPYLRGVEKDKWVSTHQYFIHIGMYAYRTEVLKEITRLAPAPLEVAESLEQLRWISNGYTVKVSQTNRTTIGIDTAEDLEEARRYCIENNL